MSFSFSCTERYRASILALSNVVTIRSPPLLIWLCV